MEFIISLISGAVGGNAAGTFLKKYDLGPLFNSLAGIVGGGLGGSILSSLGAEAVTGAAATGGMDIGSILGSIATGGVGGGVVLVVVGLIKQILGK